MCVASERLCVGVFLPQVLWKASSFGVIQFQSTKVCLKLTCRCFLTVSLHNTFKLARRAPPPLKVEAGGHMTLVTVSRGPRLVSASTRSFLHHDWPTLAGNSTAQEVNVCGGLITRPELEEKWTARSHALLPRFQRHFK